MASLTTVNVDNKMKKDKNNNFFTRLCLQRPRWRRGFRRRAENEPEIYSISLTKANQKGRLLKAALYWVLKMSRNISLYSTATLNHLVLGPRICLDSQHHNFALGIPTCWYLKTLKFALPPVTPMPTPKESRWNIGGVGYIFTFLACD